MYDCATTSYGGGDFPSGEHERCVPRGDDADRADGFAGCDVQLIRGVERFAVAGLYGFVCEKAKVYGGTDRGLGHETQRLARVHPFGEGDFFGARFDPVCDAV